MTREEKIRFALVLGEADSVRAMIAEDEAAEGSEEDTQQKVPLGIAAWSLLESLDAPTANVPKKWPPVAAVRGL